MIDNYLNFSKRQLDIGRAASSCGSVEDDIINEFLRHKQLMKDGKRDCNEWKIALKAVEPPKPNLKARPFDFPSTSSGSNINLDEFSFKNPDESLNGKVLLPADNEPMNDTTLISFENFENYRKTKAKLWPKDNSIRNMSTDASASHNSPQTMRSPESTASKHKNNSLKGIFERFSDTISARGNYGKNKPRPGPVSKAKEMLREMLRNIKAI